MQTNFFFFELDKIRANHVHSHTGPRIELHSTKSAITIGDLSFRLWFSMVLYGSLLRIL